MKIWKLACLEAKSLPIPPFPIKYPLKPVGWRKKTRDFCAVMAGRVEKQAFYLDNPCWYFSIRPSYLPSAISWTSWSARLSSISSDLSSPQNESIKIISPFGLTERFIGIALGFAALLSKEPAQGACQPDKPVCHLFQDCIGEVGKHLHMESRPLLGGVWT